jgi:hypothetical protein
MLPIVPAGVPLWWYICALGLGAMIIGIAKAGFGGGITVLSVPLVANALPADRAIGVLLPILIMADVAAVWHHRRHRSGPHLLWTVSGALIGMAVGGAYLWMLQETGRLTTALNLLVGSICVLFVLIQCYRLMGGKVPQVPTGPRSGVAAGTIGGVTSMLSHSAGPIMSIYLLEQRLPRQLLVGTLVIFFFVINCIKVPVYIGLHLMTWPTMVEALLFGPFVPVGTLLGIWMHRRIPEKPFAFIMYAGAAIAGSRMIYLAVI